MKNPIAPADVVKNWFRTYSAIEYMGLWERFYNPDVKVVEIDQFLSQSGAHSFTLSPKQWIEKAKKGKWKLSLGTAKLLNNFRLNCRLNSCPPQA